MALNSKKYTKVSETLFDIMDAIADGLAAAESNTIFEVQLHSNTKAMCMRWMGKDLNSVTMKADVNADSCVVTVVGEGSWYTSMTGPLNTLFGV